MAGKVVMICSLLAVVLLAASAAAGSVRLSEKAEMQLFHEALGLALAEAALDAATEHHEEMAEEAANLNVKCVPNGQLTRGILRSIINTEASRQILSQRRYDSKTYLTPDFGKTVYSSCKKKHAEDNLIKSNTWPSEFWINNSPCMTKCAKNLMEKYKEHNKDRPTIYIAHLYVGENTASARVKAINCLAAMVKDGFTILPWDWAAFQDELKGAQGCRNDITTALADDRFKDKANELSEIIVQINNRSKDNPVCS